MLTDTELRHHLENSRLAGQVATPPSNSLGNVDKLLDGDPDHTFGLSDYESAVTEDILDAVRTYAGVDLTEDPEATSGYIDPDSTIAGINRHAELLREVLVDGDAKILLATGHPMGLLGHYIELARALTAAGNHVLTALDDRAVLKTVPRPPAGYPGVRFIGGVACVFDEAAILHTHRSVYMEAMLDDLKLRRERPDLVIGDHGMAGAAIERRISTLSIADVNDHALPLAAKNQRHEAVLVIDDNLRPATYEPITTAMLERAWRDR